MQSTGILAFGAAVAFFVLMALVMKAITGKVKRAPAYEVRRDALFTKTERSFLHVLDEAVGTQFRVMGKVRLADLFKPCKGMDNSERTKAQNRINAKHVDFVLCDPESMAPVCLVELDDGTHARLDRRERDAFVDQVCAEAGMPIAHIPARDYVTANEILTAIGAALAEGRSR